MHLKCLRYGTLVSCVCLTVCGSAVLADWPNFRGPAHDGISPETGLKTDWDRPIPMRWERKLGSAFSSFAVVDGRLYTCGNAGGMQVLYCLNADTGETIWEQPFEKEYRDSHGDGTRATPTVHEGRVYILGGHGRLLCADARDGSEIWSRRFDHAPTWGYSGSVLIEGDLAIATAGEDQGTLAALDKRTGEVQWTCGDEGAGYATPYPFTFNGKRYVAGFSGEAAFVCEADTGRLALRIPWKTSYGVNAAMPILHDGHLFLTSGYTTGCGLFRLSADGDGLAAREVWRSQVLLNKFQSCLLLDGKLYASDQKSFKCVDWKTGDVEWEIHRIKHGPLTFADGNLFLLTQDGTLMIGPASPSGFTGTTEAEILSGRCWTVPVIDDGRLYARSLERVVAFDLTP